MNFMKSNEKELEIVLTYKCNWNCSYCCVDTHNQKDIDQEILFKKIDTILSEYKDYNITLSGGEVGLLDKSIILYIIDKLKFFNLSLNTNGLFLEKYPELISKFNNILYHCSPELDDRNVLLNLPNHIQYMIVITDNNITNLELFLNYYNDIKFHLVPASNPWNVQKPILSKKNKLMILKKYRKHATIESQLRLISEKDFDNIIYL